MLLGVGTDILQIERIAEVVSRQGERFVERILTPAERREYAESGLPLRLLAKRFAAKEAVAKALGTGIGRGVSWQDIEISHDGAGKPLASLSGGALEVARRLGGSRVALSISDEQDYAVAFAVLTS